MCGFKCTHRVWANPRLGTGTMTKTIDHHMSRKGVYMIILYMNMAVKISALDRAIVTVRTFVKTTMSSSLTRAALICHVFYSQVHVHPIWMLECMIFSLGYTSNPGPVCPTSECGCQSSWNRYHGARIPIIQRLVLLSIVMEISQHDGSSGETGRSCSISIK